MKIKLNEALTQNKFSRIKNKLNVDLRQLIANPKTDPEKLKNIAISLQAIEEISENKGFTDGKVSSYKSTKYQKIIRDKEFELRTEVLKNDPDITKVAEVFVLLKALKSLASSEGGDTIDLKEEMLDESIFIREPDLALNIEDFKEGKSDRIFITGISGSGKSTLAKEIAKMKGAVHVDLDSKARELKSRYGDEMFSNTIDPKFVSDKFIEEIEKEIKNNKGKLVVIEGVQIQKIDFDYLKDYPIYSLNTPLIKSFVMGRTRDQKKGKPLNLMYNFKENLKRDKRMKTFNEKMKKMGSEKHSVEELLGISKKDYMRSIMNEMSVSGIAATDNRAASPIVKPIFPGSKEEDDEDEDKELYEFNRNNITRPNKPKFGSEFSDDLEAMYGKAMELTGEDKESYEEAREYLKEESNVRYILEKNLFDNIRAKRERISKGSGEKKAKPGDKDYPENLKKIANDAKLNESISTSELREIFTKIGLDTEKYKVEYLAEQMGFQQINEGKWLNKFGKMIVPTLALTGALHLGANANDMYRKFDAQQSHNNITQYVQDNPGIYSLSSSGNFVPGQAGNSQLVLQPGGALDVNSQQYEELSQEEKDELWDKYDSGNELFAKYSQKENAAKDAATSAAAANTAASALYGPMALAGAAKIAGDKADKKNKENELEPKPEPINEGQDVYAMDESLLEAMAVAKAKNILRKLELQLRQAVIKSKPDLNEINSIKLNMDAIRHSLQSKNTDGKVSDDVDFKQEKKKKQSNKKLSESTITEKLVMPKKEEEKNDFVSRFMSSKQAKIDFPDHKQRVAVAFSQLKRAGKINEELFRVSIENPEGKVETHEVDADNSEAAIDTAIDAYGVDVENIRNIEQLNESKSMLVRYRVKGYNKPKRTPDHKTKSHLVVAKKGDQVKVVRFGAQGAKGSPKKDGESESYRKRRKGFVARHKAQNPSGMKDKFSALYWANKVKW